MTQYIIYGYGKSGKALCNLLHNNQVYIYDDNPSISQLSYEQAKHIAYNTQVIYSPGVNYHAPLLSHCRCNGIVHQNEFEFSSKRCKARQIAITGTNGKTTITSLVGHVLSANKYDAYVLGNIGIPLANKCDLLTPTDYAVLEVSSYQLRGYTDYCPYVSAIANISPDHLNVHDTYDDYIQSKLNILRNQTDNETCVLNYDDDILVRLGTQCKARIIYFSAKRQCEGVYYDKTSNCIVYNNSTILKFPKDIKYYVKHNISNILCAVAICIACGLTATQIYRILSYDWLTLKHRVELVAEYDGICFYNDSKATNIGATLFAVSEMDNFALILGGSGKGTSFESLISGLINSDCKLITCVGQTAQEIYQCAKQLGFNNVICCADLNDAVHACYRTMQSTHTKANIILSPACASFDKYKNYEQRGEHFREIVTSLIEHEANKHNCSRDS